MKKRVQDGFAPPHEMYGGGNQNNLQLGGGFANLCLTALRLLRQGYKAAVDRGRTEEAH